MTFKCSVPGCRSNYDKEKGKYTVFSFPKNEALHRLWVKAMPIENFQCHKHSKVCELHFEPWQIIREASGYDSQKQRFLTAPLCNPRLSENAIPSRFATPGCPPLTPQKRRTITKIKGKKKTRKAENIETIGTRRLAEILMTESGFESLEVDEPSSVVRKPDEANTIVPNVIYLNKSVPSSSSSSLTSRSPSPSPDPLTDGLLSPSCLQSSDSLSSVVSHTGTVTESHSVAESSIVIKQEPAETTNERPQAVFDNIPFVEEFVPSSSTSSISCSLPCSSSSSLTNSSSVSCSLPSSSSSSLTNILPLSNCVPPSSNLSSVVSQAGTETVSKDIAELSVVIKQEPVESTNEPPQMAADNVSLVEEFVPSTGSSSVSCSLPSSRSVPPSSSLSSVVSQAGKRTESQGVAESSVVIKQELVESTNEPPQMAVDNIPLVEEFVKSTSSSSVSCSLPSTSSSSVSCILPSTSSSSLTSSLPFSINLSTCFTQAGTGTESQNVAELPVAIEEELVESTNEPPQMAVDNIPLVEEFVKSTSSSSVSCSLPSTSSSSVSCRLPSTSSSSVSCRLPSTSSSSVSCSLPSTSSSSVSCNLPSTSSSSLTSSLPFSINLSTCFTQAGTGTESQNVAELPVAIEEELVEPSSKPSPVVVDNILYVKEFMPSSSSSSLPRNLPIFFISSPSCKNGFPLANSDSTLVNATSVANKPKRKRKINYVNDSTTCAPRAKVNRLAKPRDSPKRLNEEQLHSKTMESAGSSVISSDDTPNVTRDVLQSLLKDSKNGPLHDSRTSEKPGDLFDVLGSYIAEKLRGMNLADCASALKTILDTVSKTGQVPKVSEEKRSEVPNPEED